MPELDHTQAALIEIIRASKAALDVATADLKAEPNPSALDRVSQEADVLSSAIAALARNTDLGALKPPPAETQRDDGMALDQAERLIAALEGDICPICNGAISQTY